jgi:hypothetical protein
MPNMLLNDPRYWRDRAEEARALAARLPDQYNRLMMLRVAEGRKRQAETLQRARDRLTERPPNR